MAKYGEYPTTALPTQPESDLGGAAQALGSRQVWDLEKAGLAGPAIAAKKAAVKADWEDMAGKASKQLRKRQWVDMQSTLALRMTKLKQNMRDVARAMNGGDLIVYEEGKKETPSFDYGIGTYELTEQAKLTEEVVAQINRAYVAAGQRDAAQADLAWEGAQQAFIQWSSVVAW
mmetsp:Transcript_11550/g.27436  ORF Transcript_11550/g.27436 Transcript_11550/m.27436 type:complete len:174 (-) Transcript_11550:139-660(-)